jgi:hypothetical protein
MTVKKVQLKRNSANHIALCMMKVARRPIDIKYLREMNGAKFNKRGPADFKPLIDWGFATFDGENYQITQTGIAALYAITAQQPRPNPTD